MITTVKSLAENVASTYGRGDDLIIIEIIKRRILYHRQILLQQYYERSRMFIPSTIQTFDVKLTKQKQGDSFVYVSDTLPIPLLIRGRREPFISVTNPLKGTTRKSFSWVEPEELYYLKYRKFTNKQEIYTYDDLRLYHLGLERVTLRAVWENPLEVKNFSVAQDTALGCSEPTMEASCFLDDELLLEETIAGKILNYFGNAEAFRKEVEAEESAETENNR